MSSIEPKNINNDILNDEFNETTQNPFSSIPDEIVLEIFSNVNLATLGIICRVSKESNRLASKPTLWKTAIYREIAFSNDKWAHCFGKDIVKDEDCKEEFSSLPWNDFIADCKKFKFIFPEKKAKDILMLVRLPKTLHGKLTLKSLGELAKKYFSNSDTGYRFIWSDIVKELGEKSIDKSRWVLMTKVDLPGSRNKSYLEQKNIVADLAQKALINYEVTETLEAVVCILTQYFDSQMRLFSDNPKTYIRCKDVIQGSQPLVGCFKEDGLYVGDNYLDEDLIAIAALRKF